MPTFRTVIEQARQNATGIPVPPEAIDALDAGKRPAVIVTIGQYSYRSTVGVMGGRFLIPLSAEHRSASGLSAGDEVDVHLERDTEAREAVEPAEFTAALEAEPSLRRSFDALSSSRRRALVDPLAQAKTAETRQRRLDKALEQLRGSAPVADGS
ncbi:hypothetical protein AS850_12685 [Frondihabitans sp. 762G35]|uniref:YdeI/OmpD-associated family protein n=1 Tax=Frondihabitans sp. 762G35 TaxID=1446794 RepID=UPI000D20F530|nr:YdeI/OmpD-associated family protein [Frondihabitans sp. 762G35]ARC57933.1 hypothetical protein AS850_12685 [Frondihabitans sp. 762G35]